METQKQRTERLVAGFRKTLEDAAKCHITETSRKVGTYVRMVKTCIEWLEKDAGDGYAINLATEKELFIADAIEERSGRRYLPGRGFAN